MLTTTKKKMLQKKNCVGSWAWSHSRCSLSLFNCNKNSRKSVIKSQTIRFYVWQLTSDVRVWSVCLFIHPKNDSHTFGKHWLDGGHHDRIQDVNERVGVGCTVCVASTEQPPHSPHAKCEVKTIKHQRAHRLYLCKRFAFCFLFSLFIPTPPHHPLPSQQQ